GSRRDASLNPGGPSMKVRLLAVILTLSVITPWVRAQPDAPKPGPEHEKLKAMVGEWETTVKVGGGESKGKATWKQDIGSFFVTEEFEGEFGGMKFQGRGTSGYCPIKKKYFT